MAASPGLSTRATADPEDQSEGEAELGHARDGRPAYHGESRPLPRQSLISSPGRPLR